MVKRGKIRKFFASVFGWTEQHPWLFACLGTTLFLIFSIIALRTHTVTMNEIAAWEGSKNFSFESPRVDVNSPIFWTALISLFSKNGCDIHVMAFLTTALTTIALFLFLRFVKLKNPVKLATIFSAAFLYFLPTSATNYGLLPLAIVFVMLSFKSRFRHPVVYGLALSFLTLISENWLFISAILIFDFIIGFCFAPCAKKVAREKALKKANHKEAASSIKQIKLSEKRSKDTRAMFVWIVPALALIAAAIFVVFKDYPLGEEFLSVKNSEFYNVIDRALYGTAFPFFEITAIIIVLTLFVRDLRAFFYYILAVTATACSSLIFSIDGVYSLSYFISFIAIDLLIYFIYVNDPKKPLGWQTKLNKLVNKIQIVKLINNIPSFVDVVFVLPIILTIPHVMNSLIEEANGDKNSVKTVISEVMNEGGSVAILTDNVSEQFFYPFAYELPEGSKIIRIENGKELIYDSVTVEAVKTDAAASTIKAVEAEYDHVYYFGYVGTCASAVPVYGEAIPEGVPMTRFTPTTQIVRLAGAYYPDIVGVKLK